MAIGTALLVAKEAAKKAVRETVKQVAKETQKGNLKDKLKQAVKEEAKEFVKEEINENVVDTRPTVTAMAPGDLKAKLQQTVKEKVQERVDENIVDTKSVKVLSDAGVSSERKTEAVEKTDSPVNTQERTSDSMREKLNNMVSEAQDNSSTSNSDVNTSTENSEKKTESYDANSYVTIDGEKYRTDDNGNIYQKRNPDSGTYECLPNTSYDLNGYHYETDEQGRITSASGTLKEKNHEGRSTINDEVVGIQENDEKGHLIGDQFEGSNLNGNLVAMDFDVNRSDYKIMEERLAKAVSEGKNVTVDISVKYEGDSLRPSGFVVKYTIDGEMFKEKFTN